MSLCYRFRGTDAEQLRGMRAGAAVALTAARTALRPAGPPAASAQLVQRALHQAVAIFPCLRLAAPDSTATDSAAGAAPTGRAALRAALAELDGDGTPWSYLCASVLRRELEAFDAGVAAGGALPHGAPPGWPDQQIVDGEPAAASSWEWGEPPPGDWGLLVMEDSLRVFVRFFGTAPPPGVALWTHEDWYRRGLGYEARASSRAIARWRVDGPDPTARPPA